MKKTMKIFALLLATLPMVATAQVAKTPPEGNAYTIRSAAPAVGGGAVAYQWYRNDVAIPNATEANYTVPANEAYGVGIEFKRRADCGGMDVVWSNAVLVSFLPTQTQTPTIMGSVSICPGASGLTYWVTNVAGTTYNWTVPAGWTITAGQSTNIITVTAGANGGTVSVTPSSITGMGTTRSLEVSITAAPAQPSEITGSASICPGASGLTYWVTNVVGVTYDWTVPSDWIITAGQNTSSITVTAGAVGGTISVTPSTCSSNNGTARSKAVSIGAAPAQPSTITGSTAVCSAQTGVTYSVTNVQGVSYNWTVPSGWTITAGQNSSSITVTVGTASGSISVMPSTTCSGNGTARTLVVAVGGTPAQPSEITGNQNVCSGQTITYSVTSVQGVTYNWTVPSGWTITAGQNTNSITVTTGSVGGTVSVTPSNCNGSGTARSLAVVVAPVPVQPYSIATSTTSICPGQTGITYSTPSYGNDVGVTYTWTVPSGWTITAGQGTNSITVTAGTTGGNVSVTPSNCNNSIGGSRSLAVAIGAVPAQPGTITASTTSVCSGQTGITYSLYSYNVKSGVTYTWTVPSGWTITGGQGTGSITVTAGSSGGTVSVTPSNCGGNGTASTLAGTINGTPSTYLTTYPTTVCSGQTGIVYTAYKYSGYSYTWTVPSGWNITAGQGTNSITVTAGTTGGNVSVTPSICGGVNGTARTQAVTVNVAPSTPSAITTSNTAVCSGQTGITYSVTNTSGTTYTWTVPDGWTITGGQGTHSITVTAGSSGGTVSVTPARCGIAGTAVTQTVTIGTAPAQPSFLSYNPEVCPGQTGVIYSVTNVSGVSYNWTVPSGWSITAGQGTDQIMVTVGSSGGNVSVTPSTACGGNGTARTLAVAVGTVPGEPEIYVNLNGVNSTAVCSGLTGALYEVYNPAPNVTYSWTVPNGWTITAGQGTGQIWVTTGSSGGNISVTPFACNGSIAGTAATLEVTASACGTSCGNGKGTAIAGLCWANTNVGEVHLFVLQPDMGGNAYNWDNANGNACPYGWRLPTQDEYGMMQNSSIPAGGAWVNVGERGASTVGRFYGPNYATCTLPGNMAGCIFLPAVSSYDVAVSTGYYWTSTSLYGSNYFAANFGPTSGTMHSNPSQSSGSYYSVRCVLDE